MRTLGTQKKLNKVSAAVMSVSVLLAAGMLTEGSAVAGITDTKHNLSGSGTGASATFTPSSGTGELCVFCHTPHGSDTSAAVPLWNRVMAAPTTYTTYNSLGTTSLDGATAPVGSVSLACLSCHDGSTAMNVMINQPGSGGYNAAGAAWAGTWTGAGQTLGFIGAPGSVTRIGTDLKNDHPIGIQYGGGMVGGGAYTKGAIAAGTLRDADFKGVQYANVNGNDVWWVDVNANGTRDKTDMILYTRTDSASVNQDQTTGATLTGAQAFVECASCHDPHTSSQPTFLRMSNAGSGLCLACHIK